MIISLDTETHRFSPGNMAPKIVCLTTTEGDEDRIYKWGPEARDIVKHILDNERFTIVGHNVAYDMACFLANAPELNSRIWNAYEQGRIHCTAIRERLIDIARGSRFETGEDNKLLRKKYSLASIAKARLGVDLDKSEWRMDFAELEDKPLAEWPQGAIDYAKTDARVTGDVWEAQELWVEDNFPEYDAWSAETARQTRYAFAFRLMQCWGLKVDRKAARELKEKLQARMRENMEKLEAAGLFHGKKKRIKNLSAVRELVAKSFLGSDIPKTDKGSISTAAEVLERCSDPALKLMVEFAHDEKLVSAFLTKLEASPTVHPNYHCLGADSGRSSASDPNIQQQPREPGVRECFVAREGCCLIACDYDSQELRTLAQVLLTLLGKSKLADSYRENPDLDPHTAMASNILKISYEEGLARKKARDKELLETRQLSKACFHPDTEILTRRRGWVRVGELAPDDEVAAAYPQAHGESVIAWEKPLALTRRKAPGGFLVHLKNEGIDLRVTSDHRMLGFKKNGEPYVTIPEKLETARCWGNAGKMSAGFMPGGEKDWSLLRLAVATQADGSYVRDGHQIKFGFTKQRKIARLRTMLSTHASALWFEKKTAQMTTFVLQRELATKVKRLLDPDKTLPWWWMNLPLAFREEILDEVPHWDSHIIKGGRRFHFSSVISKNHDVLQAIASVTGRKSRVTLTRDSKNPKHRDCWSTSIGDRAYSRGGALESKRIDYDGDVVCLSVPSSYVLVRDGGVTVVVGQCNFGYPGGMGAKSFQAFARGYGLEITEEDALRLREAWFAQWPEMQAYFGRVKEEVDRAQGIKQIRSGRIRGDCNFTAAANTYFQGLGADATKTALWEVAKRCYGTASWEENTSALFGCRPVAMVHDEIIIEAPLEIAHEAALELEKVMCDAMAVWCPDVPARASPALMRRWSKSADAAFDAQGRYICFEDAQEKAV